MFKYIISYDGGQLRDSGDFEWGLFNSYGEAEEAANDAKEEYMNDWDIEGSEYDPDDFCIEIVEVQVCVKILGIVIKHGKNDVGYWEGFNLTEAEKMQSGISLVNMIQKVVL